MDKIAVLTSSDVIVINEQDIVFTNEQLTKLDELRKKSGTDGTLKTRIRKSKSKFVETKVSDEIKTYWNSKNLKVGMPVRVEEQNHTFIGFIVKVYPDNWHPKFDIQTPSALLKEIDYRSVQYRKIEDLSWIKIPEELKTKTTQHLLHMLKCARIDEEKGIGDYEFTSYEIKAELANRPHVMTKSERKAVSNHSKWNKKKEKYEKHKKNRF
jgi:hypothetical protein